jgi:hypothetical protein
VIYREYQQILVIGEVKSAQQQAQDPFEPDINIVRGSTFPTPI